MTEIPPAPAWTDYDPHDPGITFLEASAYSVAALFAVALVGVWWRSGRRTSRTSTSSSPSGQWTRVPDSPKARGRWP